jgi:hypothetical protein
MRRYIGALVLVVGAATLLVGAEDRSRDEQKALDAITKLGGKITLDENAPGKPVMGVDLRGAAANDTDLASSAAPG